MLTKRLSALFALAVLILLLLSPAVLADDASNAAGWLGGSLTTLKFAIFASVLPVMLLPIFLPGLHLSSALAGKSLQSFLERMDQGWPGAWDLIFRSGAGLLGRGIGGIGSPQRIFDPQYYFPADNLTIFLFAYFGIFAVLYVAWPL